MPEIFLDAVGASKSTYNWFFVTLILSPFLFALLVVLFFKLLDRISKKNPENSE
jgi:hypothetical protein